MHLSSLSLSLSTLLLCVCVSLSQTNGPSPTAVLACGSTVSRLQQFSIQNGGVTFSDGRCLDIGDCDTTPGDGEIIVFPCNSTLCGGGNQRWTYNNSSQTLVSQLDGQCLDLNVNNGKVQTWPCLGNPNQRWVSKGGLLVNGATNECLTVAEGPVYTNPVINRDFPDPTVLRGGDGRFYVYSTNSVGCSICVSSSDDLVNWSPVSNALPNLPRWANSNFWAPDVTYHNGTYYMFFAGQQTGAYMCIGIATSKVPLGPFTDMGQPLICSPSSNSFAMIDPKMFDAPNGKIYLYWGSDFVPIRVQELDPSRMKFAAGSQPINAIPTSSAPYENLVEGAWVLYNSRTGFYYLFYSGDNCCMPNAHYAVLVARSQSPTGPFEKLGHPILTAGGRWNAPGHNSVITDDAGQDWMFYHAMDNNANGDYSRKLLMDHIVYLDGWPTVAQGNPMATPQFGPYVVKK